MLDELDGQILLHEVRRELRRLGWTEDTVQLPEVERLHAELPGWRQRQILRARGEAIAQTIAWGGPVVLPGEPQLRRLRRLPGDGSGPGGDELAAAAAGAALLLQSPGVLVRSGSVVRSGALVWSGSVVVRPFLQPSAVVRPLVSSASSSRPYVDYDMDVDMGGSASAPRPAGGSRPSGRDAFAYGYRDPEARPEPSQMRQMRSRSRRYPATDERRGSGRAPRARGAPFGTPVAHRAADARGAGSCCSAASA
ncbi:hypothetical protein NKH18_50460 [Streptomyces sp. M10(2022)]